MVSNNFCFRANSKGRTSDSAKQRNEQRMEWDTKVVKCIGPIRSMKLHDTVLCNVFWRDGEKTMLFSVTLRFNPRTKTTLSCIIQPFLSTFGIEFEGERKIEPQFPRHQHANHHLLWYFKYQFEINKSEQIHIPLPISQGQVAPWSSSNQGLLPAASKTRVAFNAPCWQV